MSKTEQLTCPACGAHEVSQISGINYQCDYCHSTFMVKEDNPFLKFDKNGKVFSKLNKEDLLKKLEEDSFPFTRTTETIFTTLNDLKKDPVTPVTPVTPVIKPSKLAGIIVGIVFLVLIGVGAAVFTFVSKTTSTARNFFSGWQKPSVDNYNCLVGSKGAIVWLILKTQTNKLDSAKYIIRLIDPITKKIILEEPLGKTTTWKETFHQSKQFDNDFYVSNDTVYNISEDGGIQGFELYTGKRLFGNEWFENKFPQLKDGISKTDKQYYKKAVKITSEGGDDFIYYLDTKQLLPEKKDEKAQSKDLAFSEEIYLTRDKKSELYLCNIKRRPIDDFFIESYYVDRYNSDKSSFRSSLKELKKIDNSVYAKAVPISKYDNDLLFFYSDGFSKHADGVLALVNKEGKFAWKNNDPSFKTIVSKNSSDNIHLNYNLSNDLIVINISGSDNESVGVDLKTGKTLFVYKQSYSDID